MDYLTEKENELLKKALQRREQFQKDKQQEEDFLINREIDNLKRQNQNRENDNSSFDNATDETDNKYFVTLNNKTYSFNRTILKENQRKEKEEKENRLLLDIRENHNKILKAYSQLTDNNTGLIKDIDYFKTSFYFQRIIKEKAISFINNYNNRPWFFIYGQYGSGKTCICEVIINELLKRFKLSVLYYVFNSLMIELKGLSNNILQIELLNKINNCDLLFIDDLFKNQNITNSDINLLFNIINYRYENNKVTLLNSQRMFNNIALFDNALFRRIYEKANNYLIKISYNSDYIFRLLKQ